MDMYGGTEVENILLAERSNVSEPPRQASNN